MYNITVGRLGPSEDAQGVIKPDNGAWQLVIDRDGVPHLWLATTVEDDSGRTVKGMVPLDAFLPEGTTVADIMGSTFTGPASPEQKEAALSEHDARGLPCPR